MTLGLRPMTEPLPIDSESEQVRDVYAYFGLALYWAQCLEQSIFQHLLFVEHFPKATATYKSAEQWAEDFDEYEERELSQTMGKLIRRLGEAGQPTEEIKRLLGHALVKRNWLAHGYFPDRAIQFTLSSGRESMIAELEAIRDLFRECANKLDDLTLPIAEKAGLTKDRLTVVEAEMLAEYAKSHTEA